MRFSHILRSEIAWLYNQFMNVTGSNPTTPAATEHSDVSAEIPATLPKSGEEVTFLGPRRGPPHTAVLIKRHIDYEFFGVLLLDESAPISLSLLPSGILQTPEICDSRGGRESPAPRFQRANPFVSRHFQDPGTIKAIESVKSELAVPLSSRKMRRRPGHSEPHLITSRRQQRS